MRLLPVAIPKARAMSAPRKPKVTSGAFLSEVQLLRHEIASEAAGVFDDHDADAVAFDPVQKLIEAGPRLDWISAGDGRIIKPIVRGDLEAGALRISRDRLALALFAILIGPDIRGARSAEIGHGFRATVFAPCPDVELLL